MGEREPRFQTGTPARMEIAGPAGVGCRTSSGDFLFPLAGNACGPFVRLRAGCTLGVGSLRSDPGRTSRRPERSRGGELSEGADGILPHAPHTAAIQDSCRREHERRIRDAGAGEVFRRTMGSPDRVHRTRRPYQFRFQTRTMARRFHTSAGAAGYGIFAPDSGAQQINRQSMPKFMGSNACIRRVS